MSIETGGLSQLIAAKQGICSVQPYYNDLGCREYLDTVSIAPTTTAVATAMPEPSTSIKGTLNMGTKYIILSTALNAGTIQAGDMLYLGYGTSMQGPFTVAYIHNPATMPAQAAGTVNRVITLTKNYIGATITNAVISIIRVTKGSDAISYTCTPGVDHVGDDLTSSNARTEAQVRAECDSDRNCLSYNVVSDGRTYTKSHSNVTNISGGITKFCVKILPTSSSPIQMDISKLPPYTCREGVDHGGDDIGSCIPRSEADTIAACNANSSCLSYNIINNGATCIKTKSNITHAHGGIIKFCVKTVPTDLMASVYPLTSFIVISTSTITTTANVTTISDSLPLNLDLGDIIYIKKDTCNQYDTDNGDGTCNTYICNMGEKDMGNNTCKPYSCGRTYTNTGRAPAHAHDEPNMVADTDNGDGTCTTPAVYGGCQPNFTYNITTNKCEGTLLDKPASYDRVIRVQPSKYDKTFKGIAGTPYTKTTANISYKYSKIFGPYIISMKPSTNKLMIRSVVSGDLDANGKFILNPTADSYIKKREWVSNIRSGAAPSVNNSINLKALPEIGLVNAKLYKLNYVSFKNIINAYNTVVSDTEYSKKVICDTVNSESLFHVSNANVTIGSRYSLTISIKVVSGTVNNTIPSIRLEHTNYQYYTTASMVPKDNDGRIYLSNIYTTIVWEFTAATTTLQFRVNKSSASELTVLDVNALELLNIIGYNGPA
jgi:hypothetical protein